MSDDTEEYSVVRLSLADTHTTIKTKDAWALQRLGSEIVAEKLSKKECMALVLILNSGERYGT
jgi:hypothetical protein